MAGAKQSQIVEILAAVLGGGKASKPVKKLQGEEAEAAWQMISATLPKGKKNG